MIPRLLCALFGHVWRVKNYTAEDQAYNERNPSWEIWHWKECSRCPRCGAWLEGGV